MVYIPKSASSFPLSHVSVLSPAFFPLTLAHIGRRGRVVYPYLQCLFVFLGVSAVDLLYGANILLEVSDGMLPRLETLSEQAGSGGGVGLGHGIVAQTSRCPRGRSGRDRRSDGRHCVVRVMLCTVCICCEREGRG
jgi:hypothetical protein